MPNGRSTMDKKNSLVNEMKKAAKGGAKAAVIGVGAIAGGIPGLVIGYAAVTNARHLSCGFKAALTSWRRQNGHSLSLKAKLLRFRNAVSYGIATAKENRREMSHKRSMAINPYYKESYEKAVKAGRRMKLSEKLNAKLKFLGTAAKEYMFSENKINPQELNKMLSQRGR